MIVSCEVMCVKRYCVLTVFLVNYLLALYCSRQRGLLQHSMYMLAMFSYSQQLYCILYLIACGGIVAI